MAHELGWPVSLVKKLTSIGEFRDWQAYFCMRKQEYDKEDYLNANLCTVIAQANSDGKQKYRIDDFLLKYKDTSEPEDIFATFKQFFGFA